MTPPEPSPRAPQPLPSKRRAFATFVALIAVGAALQACPTPAMDPSTTAHEPGERRYRDLLERYVDARGHVDYAAWSESPEDVAALDAHVETLLDSPPKRGHDGAAALSYWLNLYNALVLREIVARWPLSSVWDIPTPDGSVGASARGFFHDLEFRVGRRTMSLLDIETEVVRRRFDDPRAHLALHCGTRSCPMLPGEPFEERTLERRLEQAARAFINHGDRVVVDHDAEVVQLSPVLGWYESDYVDFVEARTGRASPTLLDFVRMYADEPLREALGEAAESDYGIELMPYDWRLNRIGPPEAEPPRAPKDAPVVLDGTEPLPELSLPLLDGGRWVSSDAKGKVVLVDFWATWCRPCLQAFPKYADLQLKYERQGFEVVAVAQDDARAPVQAFAEANETSIPIALDPGHRASGPPLSVTTLPTVLLVDRRGIVRYRHEGYSRTQLDRLREAVETLLSEGATAADGAEDGAPGRSVEP